MYKEKIQYLIPISKNEIVSRYTKKELTDFAFRLTLFKIDITTLDKYLLKLYILDEKENKIIDQKYNLSQSIKFFNAKENYADSTFTINFNEIKFNDDGAYKCVVELVANDKLLDRNETYFIYSEK